jgi:hypothetical protein
LSVPAFATALKTKSQNFDASELANNLKEMSFTPGSNALEGKECSLI